MNTILTEKEVSVQVNEIQVYIVRFGPAGMRRSSDVENMLNIHHDVLQCIYNVITTLFIRRKFDVFERRHIDV